MDQWIAARGPYTMGYFKRQDIRFHWALAEAFTICDNYHCSVLGPPTEPAAHVHRHDRPERHGWRSDHRQLADVFDHTSLIRFIEARHGVHEPNMSAWRRQTCGDLTSAFRFARPPASYPQRNGELRLAVDREQAAPRPAPGQQQPGTGDPGCQPAAARPVATQARWPNRVPSQTGWAPGGPVTGWPAAGQPRSSSAAGA